jgi:iron(II)-dependent oxidoreductase
LAGDARLTLHREALAAWYRRNRERSAQLFGLVDPAAFYDRPIPRRHPFVFYEGHLPAFSFLVLNERALGQGPIDRKLEKLFERGIDPADASAARSHERVDWPARPEVQAFGRQCDTRVLDAIAGAPPATQALYTVLEHEQMHHETLVYIIHRLDAAHKRRMPQTHRDWAPPENDLVDIPAGTARLGADPNRIPFGWDNEFPAHGVYVDAFAVQRYPVTNGEYLEFVRAGGPTPPFWMQRHGEPYLLGVFQEFPLPRSWPVYATNEQARAYAQWKGLRLMSEAEFHRAAYGSDDGAPRQYPWGNDAPSALHGNFDFERFDPDPVDAHPAGASAWGIFDLVGNGWEWTGTPFAPFDGFEPMLTYPQYSADFFDGKHYVLKGASPVTARELIRPSFRNWFYADYPYAYGKFRCAAPKR